MKKLIQRLSDTSEFILVVSVTFGLFIYQSFYTYIEPGNALTAKVTEGELLRMVATEIGLGILALYILWVRGWSRSHFRLSITTKETGLGVLLWVADNFAYVLAIIITGALFGNALFVGNDMEFGTIHPGVVLILSIVNPLFEETFVVCYVVQALEKKHDPFFVISVSAFIRLLYHTYQGPVAILIIPLGLLHAYVFWRWRRLWPLVVAHGIFNFTNLI